jgi:hypothetical protein
MDLENRSSKNLHGSDLEKQDSPEKKEKQDSSNDDDIHGK